MAFHHTSPRREQLSRLVSCVVSPGSSISSTLNISGTTPLSRAIVKEQWNQVLHLATEYPEQARKWFVQKGAGLFGAAAVEENRSTTTTTVVEPVRVLLLADCQVSSKKNQVLPMLRERLPRAHGSLWDRTATETEIQMDP